MSTITDIKPGSRQQILPLLLLTCGIMMGTPQADTAMPAGWRLSMDNFYLWGGLFVRARAYNALLQGQFRDSPVGYSRSALYPVIANVWIGLEYVLGGGIRLGYSWHGETAEVRHGKGSHAMTWGNLSITGSW